jgi:S1-C subfamily serine protease
MPTVAHRILEDDPINPQDEAPLDAYSPHPPWPRSPRAHRDRGADSSAAPALALALGSGPRAVRIGGVEAGGPAASVGLQEGDILLSLDGTAVTGTDDLTKLLGTERIGRETLVSFVRGGKLQRASLRAIERGR